jgi:hypothetical protein
MGVEANKKFVWGPNVTNPAKYIYIYIYIAELFLTFIYKQSKRMPKKKKKKRLFPPFLRIEPRFLDLVVSHSKRTKRQNLTLLIREMSRFRLRHLTKRFSPIKTQDIFPFFFFKNTLIILWKSNFYSHNNYF